MIKIQKKTYNKTVRARKPQIATKQETLKPKPVAEEIDYEVKKVEITPETIAPVIIETEPKPKKKAPKKKKQPKEKTKE